MIDAANTLRRRYAKDTDMRFLLTAVAMLALIGCGSFDSEAVWKDGPFEVEWINTKSNSHLAYREAGSSISVGIIGECVFAAGANAEYAAVQQRQPISWRKATSRRDPRRDHIFQELDRNHDQRLSQEEMNGIYVWLVDPCEG